MGCNNRFVVGGRPLVTFGNATFLKLGTDGSTPSFPATNVRFEDIHDIQLVNILEVQDLVICYHAESVPRVVRRPKHQSPWNTSSSCVV